MGAGRFQRLVYDSIKTESQRLFSGYCFPLVQSIISMVLLYRTAHDLCNAIDLDTTSGIVMDDPK